ncbi:putative alcohol dehydrogenase [Escherichia coli]|uniref:Putative alcohol dehydrogenase n=1 Tax=Escherichia coli TaxID=562 RepID=A0A376Y4T2_ECOLX|nr:putative alcohol dehydrogenase [Escherichia coli]STM17083.1 putative alcohol dehydrogenase [Escherichia coli]STM87569.1 putative alcohol dehydrogenase [Escherichia coli]VTM68294.1 putative alcohol dehydrogenase [Escherichia coli]
MNNFNLHTPTRILFGKGAIAGLREQIPHDARVLITYGGGSVKKNRRSRSSSGCPERHGRAGIWRY